MVNAFFELIEGKFVFLKSILVEKNKTWILFPDKNECFIKLCDRIVKTNCSSAQQSKIKYVSIKPDRVWWGGERESKEELKSLYISERKMKSLIRYIHFLKYCKGIKMNVFIASLHQNRDTYDFYPIVNTGIVSVEYIVKNKLLPFLASNKTEMDVKYQQESKK